MVLNKVQYIILFYFVTCSVGFHINNIKHIRPTLLQRQNQLIMKTEPNEHIDHGNSHQPSEPSPRPLLPRFLDSARKSLATAFAVVAILLHLPSPSFAKGKSLKSGDTVTRKKSSKGTKSKSSKGSKKSSSSAATKPKTDGSKSSPSPSKVLVEVQVPRPVNALDEAGRDKQLTRIGLVMVAGTVAGTVLFGGGKQVKTATKPSPPPPPPAKDAPYRPLKTIGSGPMGAPKKPVSKANDAPAIPKKPYVGKDSPVPARPPASPLGRDKDLFDEDEVEVTPTASTPPPPPAPPSVPAATPSPPASVPKPAPAKEKKGIFGRLFPPSVSRPTSVAAALATQDAAAPFRRAVATSLIRSMSGSVQSSLSQGGVSPLLLPTAASGAELAQQWPALGLGVPEAAEAFADVASSALVSLLDRALAQLDAVKERSKAKKEKVEEEDKGGEGSAEPDPFVSAVDNVVDIVQSAGALFPVAVAADATLSTPVQYNGAAKKGRLEDLYVEYAKFGMLRIGSGDLEAMGEKSILLGQALGFKSGKRESLDQRVLREVMMSMGGGGGGGFNLGDMMGAFKGGLGGGDGKGMPLPSLEDLDPSIKDLSAEQLQQFSAEALQAVKQGLQEGSIGREDVLELEKAMGGQKLESLVGMLKQMEKTGVKGGLGDDFDELMSIFNALAEIKKRK